MVPADDDAPPHDGAWVTIGAALLGLGAATQVAAGVAAIAGLQAIQNHIDEIESDPRFGHLYLSLPVWGVLLLLVGGLQLGGALRLQRGKGRLAGLAAVLPGLVLAFFTLALLREAAVVTIVLLVAALYVLSYRVDD